MQYVLPNDASIIFFFFDRLFIHTYYTSNGLGLRMNSIMADQVLSEKKL